MTLALDVELPRRDFTLRVSCRFEGGAAGVVGPSGSGKSSLFRLIAGLDRPTRGRIVHGERVLVDTERGHFLPPCERELGFVFQDRLLFPHLTVAENLRFGQRYARRQRVRFDDLIGMLELGRLLATYPTAISGGEAQRVAIGRALMAGPELLLLDEPLSAVDGPRRLSILPYLRALRDELGIDLLVISHDLGDVQRLTDQVYVLEGGRLTGSGSAVDLLARGPCSGYLAEQPYLNVLQLHDPEPLAEGSVAYRLGPARDLFVVVPEDRGPQATLVLAPNEIALSMSAVDGLSIQNQLQGVVRRMRSHGSRITCEVDVGVPLVAEVTASAAASLNLSAGKRVYCLFKASAPAL